MSVLVPFGGREPFRTRNWTWLRSRWERLHPDWELVEGRDEGDPFSRSAAINRAARQASGDLFVIFDADVALDPELLRRAVTAYQRGVVLPWRVRHSLTRAATDDWTSCEPSVDPPRPEILWQGGGSSEILVSRAAFETVGGFDEGFFGWGYEDTAFVTAVNTLCAPYEQFDGDLWHLWHPTPSYVRKDRNAALMAEYEAAAWDAGAMWALLEHRAPWSG